MRPSNSNGTEPRAGGGSFSEEDMEKDSHEKGDEEDEVKLLRLRTRKHEIVIVPDRKYLLCVVHDTTATPSSAASGGGGGAISSR
jgi:hypothetical protein